MTWNELLLFAVLSAFASFLPMAWRACDQTPPRGFNWPLTTRLLFALIFFGVLEQFIPPQKPRHVTRINVSSSATNTSSTPAAPQPPRSSTAILMVDSRLPISTGEISHVTYCIAINMRFANRYGLAFLFYHARGDGSSVLEYGEALPETSQTFYGRHPAWARVPALYHALRNHSTAVYIDSDAIFNTPQRLTLENLWLHALNRQSTAVRPASVSDATVLCLWNQPYTTRKGRKRPAHTGFLMVQKAEASDNVLRDWWRAPLAGCCGRYSDGRDWDQGAFNEGIVASPLHKRVIAIAELTSMKIAESPVFLSAGVEAGRRQQFMLHFTGKHLPKKQKAIPMLRSRLRGEDVHIIGADLRRAASDEELDSLVNTSAACLFDRSACARAGMRGISVAVHVIGRGGIEPSAFFQP